MKKIYYLTLLLLSNLCSYSQNITIEFPKFAGKTYEFIIFQGDKQVKIYENDSIPKDGVVKIEIPKEYAPYTGMCRWLITNTAEGGGLDMAIPGYGFKVSCFSDKPDESNIKWDGYDAMNELNRLHREQQTIIDKFETMSKALQLYDKKHALYAAFQNEKETQIKEFEDFQLDLKKNSNYNARFLPIVNLVNGIPPKLTDDYELKAKYVNDYIVNELNYDQLYTSGHWTSIIQSWIQLHAQMYNDKDKFIKDFSVIHTKITDPKKYTDFVGKVTYFLTQYTKDDFIEAIAPLVLHSKKITSYEGKTMQVYVTARVGSQAPDLVITEHSGTKTAGNQKTTLLKSAGLATGKYTQTLLMFYESGCGHCSTAIESLNNNYKKLTAKGIKIIAFSADTDDKVFKETAAKFPLQATNYCDFKGMNGVNFTNYAVVGTPTLYLLDRKGIILKKPATVDEVVNSPDSYRE